MRRMLRDPALETSGTIAGLGLATVLVGVTVVAHSYWAGGGIVLIGALLLMLGSMGFIAALTERRERALYVDAWHERMIEGIDAVTLSIIEADEDVPYQTVTCNAVVSGRLIANQRLTIQDIYFEFSLHRWMPFPRWIPFCNVRTSPRYRGWARELEETGLYKMEPGETLEFGRQTLFSELNVRPLRQAKLGQRIRALLVVECAYPQLRKRFDLRVREDANPPTVKSGSSVRHAE